MEEEKQQYMIPEIRDMDFAVFAAENPSASPQTEGEDAGDPSEEN